MTDGPDLGERLRPLLEEVPGIVAAWLFGSRARGDATATSDVDVALLLDQPPSSFETYPLAIAGELESKLALPVDVVVLNGAPSDLVHRVLADGILLVDRDRGTRIRFEVRARNDYFDMMPIRDAYRRRSRGASR